MTQSQMFGCAKWICAEGEVVPSSIVISKTFTGKSTWKAKLKIIGLGTFTAYLNGKRIGEDYFLPLNSEYENIDEPQDEQLRQRIYCVEYDVTPYLRDGENVFSVFLGFGWYTGTHLWGEVYKRYGEKKLIYTLDYETKKGEKGQIFSDGEELWSEGFVVGGNIHNGEQHDYRRCGEEIFNQPLSCPKNGWKKVSFAAPVKSEYCFTDCPADKLQETLVPTVVYECEEYTLYDAGKNLSGYPVLGSSCESSQTVEVFFSEQLNGDKNDLSPERMHGQKMQYVTCGGEETLYPRFTWFGFRYFRVHGKAVCDRVDMICADVQVSSRFETDNETLNWIYRAFLQTQENNMHRGIPSDCPHIERLGYTGDGQLACRSVLHSFDGKAFYRKWIEDILDCQDAKTGHVQYTAPYVLAGGGPGGWGSAIVIVPYEFWKYYGDESVVARAYPQMWKYLDFMATHSEGGLVVRGLPGKWFLGDWCTPPDNSTLPAPFVNTYYYVKCMQRMIEIASAIGKESDIPLLQARIDVCKRAMETYYYNGGRDQTYIGNVQGASAFALDLGMGTEVTKEKFIRRYQENPWYDTGIFATELVTRQLFSLGAHDVAFQLLTQSVPHGYGRWMEEGATTLLEYWNGRRSHDHPMFGAVVASMFEYIVGIRQEDGSCGYRRVCISPANIDGLNQVDGEITTPQGKISVSYKKENGKCSYCVTIPQGVTAVAEIDGREICLSQGENKFVI